MTLKFWLLFAATEFLLSLTPGPAVFLVISQGMRFGARASVAGAAGILMANGIYFVLSAIGLGAVLIASATLFQAVKWIGVAYLIFIGSKMLISAVKAYAAGSQQAASSIKPHESPSGLSRGRLMAQGFITQLSNVKALVFFSALLPQFITPGGNVPLQCLILGTTSLAVEFPVLVAYGWVAERGSKLISTDRLQVVQESVAGLFLVGAGVGLAYLRRP